MYAAEQATQAFGQRKYARVLGSIVTIAFLSTFSMSWAQVPGEKDFNTTCFACHTIAHGICIFCIYGFDDFNQF